MRPHEAHSAGIAVAQATLRDNHPSPTFGEVVNTDAGRGEEPGGRVAPGRVDPRVAPQATLLELRTLSLSLPFPPSVNDAWHQVPYLDRKTPHYLDLDKRLRVRTVLTNEHRQYRSEVISLVHGVMRRAEIRGQPLLGRLEMRVALFYANRRRTDVDNRIKPLQDALTHAGAYDDDSQIDRIVIERIIHVGAERCDVVLTEIGA